MISAPHFCAAAAIAATARLAPGWFLALAFEKGNR
jgi:hypothetical protein